MPQALSHMGPKRPLSPDETLPPSKRVRGRAAVTDAATPPQLPHMPDEVWLGIIAIAAPTPPQLVQLGRVNRHLARLGRDDTLWRRFVPERGARGEPGAYAAFAAQHAQLPRVDQKAVGQLWYQRGSTQLLARYPEHFGVAQACAHRQGRSLQQMSEALRDDAHVVDTALGNAPIALACASERLRTEPARLRWAVAAEPSLWRFVPEPLQATDAFAGAWALRLMQRLSFGPARDAWQDVCKTSHNDPMAQAHIAACHFEMHAPEQANQAYARAAHLMPELAQLRPALAFVCAPKPDETALHQAVCRLWPRLPHLQLQAAMQRADAQWPAPLMHEDVAGGCVGPYRLETRLSRVLHTLAEQHAPTQAWDQAQALYVRAIAYSPSERQLRLGYAFMLLEAGRWEAAQAQLTPLALSTPHLLGAWTGLAMCEVAAGHFAKAKATIRRGARRTLGAGRVSSHVSMGLIAGLVCTARREPQLAPLRHMLARSPCRPRAYRAMAAGMVERSVGYWQWAAVKEAGEVWHTMWHDSAV